MVNAWSLAASILNGTFDEDYPIVKKEVEHSDAYYDYKRNDPDAENPFTDAFDYMMAETIVGNADMADIDDQYAHHFSLNTEGQEKEIMEKREPKRNHQYKYHETEIMNDIEDYVSGTYNGHYTGKEHEFRNVQTIDLMAARDIAPQFCQANILKYGSRYGSKDGRNKKDLLKVIHYAMLLLHFDGHYGKPSSSDGSFDRMP